MNDPYKVLGVSPTATDEEITKAYRALARKHHPDVNPGSKGAEQKMKEINAAYDLIRKIRSGEATYDPTGRQTTGQSPYGGGYGGYGGFGGYDIFEELFRTWQQQAGGPTTLAGVRRLIEMGQFHQALAQLARMQGRSGEWFYLSALANAGMGNRVSALAHAQDAVRLAPDNMEYRALLAQLETGGQAYRQTGRGYGFDMSSAGKTVAQLCLSQLLCYFCCRPC